MDKSEAIEFLKKSLSEIPHLRGLKYGNQEFSLWHDKILDILKAIFDSGDHTKFGMAGHRAHTRDASPEVHREDYLENLNSYETALKSIIQKYEILGIEEKPTAIEVAPNSIFREVPPKAFISHGKESAALRKLKDFVETLGIEPLIVKQQASLDKDVPDKINLYLSQADFVIILATADDTVIDKKTGKEIKQPRQNVIHEIGLAQEKLPGKIIYLLEEGAQFPSNIRPRVWESFKQRNMMDAFLAIIRELRAYGILEVTKYPLKGASS